jgi:hypothetical protein
MNNTIIKINIIKISIIISAGILISIYLPNSAQAEEINIENVVSLVNESRAEENLKPLLINPELSKIAQSKAQDMTKNHYFAHTSPEGINPWYWFGKNNYSYKYAGENLAINYDNAEEEHTAWMNSPTHKKNILSPQFTEIGIATATGSIEGKKSHITVQIFATPQKQIFSNHQTASLISKNTHILGAYSANNPSVKITTESALFNYKAMGSNNKLVSIVKNQSDKIIWTIAIIILIIISRDMVLKSIYPKNIHHKYSMINLILFIVLYSILF